MLQDLPSFCHMFFFDKQQKQSIRTLERFIYTLRQFFNFLSTVAEKNAKDFIIADLDKITISHMKTFMKIFQDQKLDNSTVAEKIYSMAAFFKYFNRQELMKGNPASLIETPKRIDKPIIRLVNDEIPRILNCINNKTRLANGRRRVNEKLLVRDKTVMMMFLLTGIRLSELVGLDIGDIDLHNAQFTILGKGGKHYWICMNDELAHQVRAYIDQLEYSSTDEPLFRSFTGTRFLTKNVNEMVKQYARWAGIKTKISPHALRRTFGTNMYKKTRDITVVSDLLRHSNINTTKKHYVDVDDIVMREALDGFSVLV